MSGKAERAGKAWTVYVVYSHLCASHALVRLAFRAGYYKRPDYKVAFVYLENPWTVPKE